ncbi:bifunctional 3,4-dihydroxy-2-butanone-4-phosphate synthase/GTP cyclohydrolase II [Treponema pectinovorum]|uniref:bifunctional 3,4-dihydroxy-2-butanone-4-phosphate synthase/GTP cyclohydrolase II n=1 Tax=Treponema pectinovorum TaxID=164 RepID=UPI003D935504
MENTFNTIEEALEDLKNGKMIMVTDDEHRENEGDLICAAQFASPEIVNFMATNAKGLICMPISKKIARSLELDPMVSNNTDNHETAFTVSIDHIETSTGISAYDRSLTAKKLIDKNSKPDDFRRPGHMFPLIAKDGGVFVRTGHTEATVDFCRLAGLEEAGLCCEIMSTDGQMARLPELSKLAKKWGLKLVSIEQLIRYRKATELIVEKVAEAKLPTKYGDFKIVGFADKITGAEHAALILGDISGNESILCRVHSECLTGDCFSSLKCDCGDQFDAAMKKIAEEKKGVLIYLRQEGRGIGLLNKIKAYALQDKGMDTVDANLALGLPADARDYNCGIQILKSLGIHKIKLMTNNPDKIKQINSKENGIEITQRVALCVPTRPQDIGYLTTKKVRMGHFL